MSDKLEKQFLESVQTEKFRLQEEGLWNRLKVGRRTLKDKAKNKLAKWGAYDEKGKQQANTNYRNRMFTELRKIYAPKLKKILKQYFGDAKVLSRKVGDNDTITELSLSQEQEMWDNLTSEAGLERMVEAVEKHLAVEITNYVNNLKG